MGLFDKFLNYMQLGGDDDYYDDESENKNVAEIIIAKNRHGATNTINLQWMGQYTTFSSADRIHRE